MISRHLWLKLLPILLFIATNLLYNYLNPVPDVCPNGHFRLELSHTCHQWLECSDFLDMTPITLLTRGLVKKIYLYKYNDNYLIVSKLSDKRYAKDFVESKTILRQLSPNPFLIQLIGWCNDDTLITEYHPYGDATRLPRVLSQTSQSNNFSLRLNLCLNYIQIIAFLHNSPIGTRVMCDSNTLDKTLSQYLVTNDFRLVLNDLDALPEVVNDSDGIKCGSRQLIGPFVAPEQLWDRSEEPFDEKLMMGYDHKTDIWKIPDVCQWFLSLGANDSEFRSSVELIESKLKHTINGCKSAKPSERPDAQQVLQDYRQVFKQFN